MGSRLRIDTLWTPYFLDTISAWYDATYGVAVDVNDKVTQWDDRSPYVNHMTQATESRRPNYIAADPLVNNLPSLFSGDNVAQYLSASSAAPAVKKAYFVCYYGDGTTSVYQDHNAIFAAIDNNVRMTGRTNETDEWDGYGGGQDNKNFEDFGAVEGTVIRNGEDTGFSGSLPMPATLWTVTSSATHDKTWRVLGNNTSSWGCWYGSLCELILTDGTESAADSAKVEGYLAHKWKLVDDLYVNHQYKNGKPTV